MLWRLFHNSKIQRYHTKGPEGEHPWALVTGASDGIGKGVALALLAQGFNVVLHGRNESKLAAVRTDLLARHPSRDVDIFVWDASRTLAPGGADLSAAVLAHIGTRRLTVLVNNVGYTSNYHTFLQQDPSEIDLVVNLQISFMTHLTRALTPKLVENQPGLIINVGGLTGKFPCPFLAVHSGGKAYLAAFSRALAIEFELVRDPPADIECLAVDVHNVSTNSNSSSQSFFTPSSETMGAAIIGVVGCGKRSVTAYWRAELMSIILGLMPVKMMDSILAKEMKDMKKRELEKIAAKDEHPAS
ncbi:NAD(P)-binding protein [Trametopsis cervina]|nr:NAD(P)-binding protein [Trametopsis cervina]